jgi:hypothetical protein
MSAARILSTSWPIARPEDRFSVTVTEILLVPVDIQRERQPAAETL